MTFTERINYILENQYFGDKKKLSEGTGIPYSTIVEYLSGKKKDPKLSLLSKLKNVDAFWLLTGKGEMLLEDEKKSSGEVVGEQAVSYKKVPSPNAIEISPTPAKTNTLIADVKASAGFGAFIENEKQLETLPAIHLPNAPQGLNIAFQIQGDSMHPTIRHLDYVAATKINAIDEVKDGHTYVVIDDTDGILCKRIYRIGKDWQIVSDNPIYPPYNRAKNRIISIFRAFCRWSYDFRNYHDDIRADVQELKHKVAQLENNK